MGCTVYECCELTETFLNSVFHFFMWPPLLDRRLAVHDIEYAAGKKLLMSHTTFGAISTC